MGWVERHKGMLFALGRPFSPLYGGAMRLRAHLYHSGLMPRHHLESFTISIGNLTMGGTGKTPHVLALARWCLEHGLTVGVVSRGYGGRVGQGPLLLEDDTPPGLSGDEPAMIKRALGIPVAVGSRRADAARLLLRHHPVDCILLDDGFQHLALERDLDLCLMDYHRPLGNGRVFPGGDMREPLQALSRASALILTRAPSLEAPPPKPLDDFPHLPCFRSVMRPGPLRPFRASWSQPSSARIGAFCGIASPGSFRASLEAMGISPRPFMVFPDHHAYSRQDLAEIEATARREGAELLVTTAKDGVKLKDEWISMPLFLLELEVELEPRFWQWLAARLRR